MVLVFQGTQQNPGAELLPDGLGGAAPPLGSGLLLPVQHDGLLQQPDQSRAVALTPAGGGGSSGRPT